VALKKNFDLPELVAFILPTTYAYYDGLPKIIDLSRNLIVFTSVIVFLLLFLFRLYKNFNNNERAVSEVLETGYFNNFFYPFVTVITDKLRSDQKVTINFRNQDQKPLQTVDIEIKVILPESKNQLADALKQINSLTHDATIDNGAWVKVRVLDNGKAVIYECPRTLSAIEKHLINGEKEYTNKDSFKFHRWFIEKFMKDYKMASLDLEVINAL